MKNDKTEINDTELEAVTGGTEPGEWSIPENGLPRPENDRYPRPENDIPGWVRPETDIPGWTRPTEDNEFGLDIQEPGTYELHGVTYGG